MREAAVVETGLVDVFHTSVMREGWVRKRTPNSIQTTLACAAAPPLLTLGAAVQATCHASFAFPRKRDVGVKPVRTPLYFHITSHLPMCRARVQRVTRTVAASVIPHRRLRTSIDALQLVPLRRTLGMRLAKLGAAVAQHAEQSATLR